MPNAVTGSSPPPNAAGGVDLLGLKLDSLKAKLEEIRARAPALTPDIVSEVITAVVTTFFAELTAKQTALLRDVEELGRAIAQARVEIATLQVDDITYRDIPFATDELDAIVDHTAQATNAILESCELLDEVAASVSGDAASKLQAATTQIYEACSFQDITGQRITKVVTTLKTIEGKVAQIIHTFGGEQPPASPAEADKEISEADLLNGPQLPALAMDQTDIDKLLASFD